MQKIQHGKATVTVVPNQVSTIHVTFPEPFEVVPDIQVSGYSSAIGVYFKGVSFTNPTATGFDICVYRTDAQNTIVHWQAVNEESYDGEDFLDYVVLGNQWKYCNVAGKVKWKKSPDANYTEYIVFWKNTVVTGYIKPADAAKFTALASGEPVSYNGGDYILQFVYDERRMQVLDLAYNDVTSKIDFYGAASVKLYLTSGTGGEPADISGLEKFIKVRYIEVEYAQVVSKDTKIFHGDGVSSFGYVNTFADEYRGTYGKFFAPISG